MKTGIFSNTGSPVRICICPGREISTKFKTTLRPADSCDFFMRAAYACVCVCKSHSFENLLIFQLNNPALVIHPNRSTLALFVV